MKRKRFLNLLITIAMLVSLLPCYTLTSFAADADTSWYNDTDTSFTITTAAQLAGLANLVNDGNNFSDKTIILGNSIDLNNEDWIPIGTPANQFYGTFDGKGYTVSGIYINDDSSSRQGLFGYVRNGTVQNVNVSGAITGGNYVGGVVSSNSGTIKNCSSSVSVSGSTYAGGVVGDNYGTVVNCSNSGDVSGDKYAGGVVCINFGTVTTCISSGNVSCDNSYASGVVGYNSSYGGDVSNCYYLNTTASMAVGAGSGTFTNAESKTAAKFASGEVAYLLTGGTTDGTQVWYQNIDNGNTADNYPVLDSTHGTVYYGANCQSTYVYSNTNLSATDGHIYKAVVTEPTCTESGYTTYTCSGCNNIYLAEPTSATGHSIMHAEEKHATCSENGNIEYWYCSNCGLYFSDADGATQIAQSSTVISATKNHSYDTDGFCTICGIGYEPATLNTDGIYEITNAGQLYWFASLINGDTIQEYITEADTSASAILTTDIDLANKEWTPIGTKAAPYTGVFDGNGYTISGLSITTEAEYIGLFGYVKEGTVENLTVSGAIDVSGDTIFAGGIVGTIYNGTLSNLTSYVNVTGETATKGTFGGVAATVEGTDKTAGSTMENCANYGDVTPSGVLDCTGGLVAYMNSATINNCANYGKVDTIGATAQQNKGVYAAGIVSYINNSTAVITNCINVGTISGAAESEDYDRYTGAIVGRVKNNVGEITNVYYLDTSADVSCAANASGVELDITAKTADELASGAVTYLLQNGAGDSVWGQDLDSDVYPTLYKTNVVKLTFTDGNSTVERYANVGIVPTNYPTPATGIYAFYTNSDMTNRIDTSSYTYTTDTTVYMAQMYTVTQNLTNVTSDNTATEAVPGSEFIANLTAADGYVIESVTVTMGNSDITNTAYSNGTVNISSVNGDIVVTAIVAKKTVEINGVTINDNSVDVDITNTLGASGIVIVAVYDADGALVDLATEDLADGLVSVGIDTANAAYVTAYIWDGVSTMIPLCDKYTATN